MRIKDCLKSNGSSSVYRRPIRRLAASTLQLEPLESRRMLTFSPGVDYQVEGSPIAIVTGDFNSDGRLDLASANTGISLLLGNPDGTFQSAITTNIIATSLAVGDFNSDGKLDLATANGSEVSLLLGNSNGTFQAPTGINIGLTSPSSVAVGDFNGDGKLDLGVTSNVYSPGGSGYYGSYPGSWIGVANVLLGNGGGSFGLPFTAVEYDYITNATLADFNGDGKLDFAVTHQSGAVSVLPGTGSGTLGYSIYSGGVGNPQSLAVGDVNGDGKLDLLSASQSGNNNVGVLQGVGDGTFTAAKYYTAGSAAASITLGDFNGDAKVDLATTDSINGTVNVLLGAGAGTFRPPVSIPAGSSAFGMAAGDFNHDGRPDVVTANLTSNKDSVLLNDGSWPALDVPSIAISDATVTEGNSGTVSAVFTVSLSAAYSQVVSVRYATTDATAKVVDGDYQGRSGTLTFAPGQTSQTITVLVNGDRVAESSETFNVNLSNPSNAFLEDASGVGVILDDEPTASIVDFVSGLEGNTGTTPMTFTVSLSAPTDAPVSVHYSVEPLGGEWTATADVDFQAKSETLTFALGETSKTITVLVNGDRTYEYVEYFLVSLDSADGARLTAIRALAEIIDDELSVGVESTTVAEGNSGTTQMLFTAAMSAPYDAPVTVTYSTFPGSASQGDDYQATSGTITFAPGETTKIVPVLVNGDLAAEGDEYFYLNLESANYAAIGNGSNQGVILDDDKLPQITISDVSGSEGQSGTKPFVFAISLSSASAVPVRVEYATANGSATANGDYQATSGAVTFASGQTSKNVTVQVKGDRAAEADETFTVNLSNATGAQIADGQGVGTIANDDSSPRISISDVTRAEGNSGTTPFVFTVSLSTAYDVPVTVKYATANGSAVANSDFQATSGTITFPAGLISKSITVPVKGDTTAEPDESFVVNLSGATSATIADGQGVGTIIDDDLPQISISDASKSEGNSGKTPFVFTVSLSAASSSRVSVHYATANGSATANGDYQSALGNVIFAAGQTSKTVTVQVKGDTNPEPNETFFVNLSGANGATIADGRGTGTIVDDDAVRIRISDVSKPEGNSGTTSFVFTVSLSAASSSSVTVNYATANGTAKTSDNDYNAKSGKLTFAPGETAKTITIAVKGDKKNEAHETFFVNLAHAKGALLDDDTGVGTILNDDTAGRNSNWIAFAGSLEEAMHDFLSDGRRQRGR